MNRSRSRPCQREREAGGAHEARRTRGWGGQGYPAEVRLSKNGQELMRALNCAWGASRRICPNATALRNIEHIPSRSRFLTSSYIGRRVQCGLLVQPHEQSHVSTCASYAWPTRRPETACCSSDRGAAGMGAPSVQIGDDSPSGRRSGSVADCRPRPQRLARRHNACRGQPH